ncbi:MAG: M23 family metallopeptidase [Alphaproteobacteria bacterium]|nr:M23 family metallopeptidase [Alphaproteobacteria bacterium]
MRRLRLFALIFVVCAAALARLSADDLLLDGEFVQGGFIIGHAPPGSSVRFEGRALRVSKEGVFVFGFGRDAGPDAELVVEFPDGRIEAREFVVAPREFSIQHIDGLPPKKVTPPPETLARIRAEGARVRAARAVDADRIDFAEGFDWPAQGRISGVYGSQRILNGQPRQPHFGIDIAGPVGRPVLAPAAGVVSLVEPDLYFSGGTLLLDHGHGVTSSFLHMSRIDVQAGQRVERGDRIGAIGATGRVTGPHLDWRINWFDARLDPGLLVGAMPERLVRPAPMRP